MSPGALRRFPGARIALVLTGAAVAVAALVAAGCDRGGDAMPAPEPGDSSAPHQPGSRVRAAVAPTTAESPREEPPAEPQPLAGPDTGPDAPTEVRTIRFVDPAGRPVVGAFIDFLHGDHADTDARGEVSHAAPVGAPLPLIYFDGLTDRRVEIREPRAEFVVRTVDVVLATVDGLTGAPVASGGLAVETIDGTPVETSESATEGTAGGTSVTISGACSARRWIGLRITPQTTETHAPGGRLIWSRPVSISARRVRIDVPLYPLQTIALRPVSERGEDTAQVGFESAALVRVRGTEIEDFDFHAMAVVRLPRSADAVLVRCPIIPANHAGFALETQDTDEPGPYLIGWSGAVAIGVPGAGLELEVPVRHIVTSGTPRSAAMQRPASPLIWYPLVPPKDAVPVTVRVRRRDGTPAPHVIITGSGASAETDDDGVATVRVVPAASDRTVTASAHGFLPTTAVLTAGAVPRPIEIVESAPRRVRVVVVDAEDRPAPGARVFASAVGGDAFFRTIAQMDGDTEIGTPRTGPDGSLLLDVCEGLVRYEVALAAMATTVDSEAAEIRVVLAKPARR